MGFQDIRHGDEASQPRGHLAEGRCSKDGCSSCTGNGAPYIVRLPEHLAHSTATSEAGTRAGPPLSAPHADAHSHRGLQRKRACRPAKGNGPNDRQALAGLAQSIAVRVRLRPCRIHLIDTALSLLRAYARSSGRTAGTERAERDEEMSSHARARDLRVVLADTVTLLACIQGTAFRLNYEHLLNL